MKIRENSLPPKFKCKSKFHLICFIEVLIMVSGQGIH